MWIYADSIDEIDNFARFLINDFTMKILKYLLITLVSLAALVVALGFFAKKTYHIERSIDIEAPKSMVFESVSQFKNIDKWSPWNELDPNMKKTYTGTDGTVGATFSWSGNEDVGEGKQTIQAVSPDRVDFLLNIGKPFKADFPASFILSGDEQKTKVTWTLDPVLPFPVNVWAMFTDVDEAMGKDYERGLGNLKKHWDAILHPKYRGFEVVEGELPVKYYVGFRTELDTSEMMAFYSVHMPMVVDALKKAEVKADGPPTGLFWTWANGRTDMAAAIAVAEEQKIDTLQIFKLEAGRTLVIDYLGAYGGMGEAHLAIEDYMKEKGLESILAAIEAYVTDPATEPDTAKWMTKVIYYVKPKVDSTEAKLK